MCRSALGKGCLFPILGAGGRRKGWLPSGVCGSTRGSFPVLSCQLQFPCIVGPRSLLDLGRGVWSPVLIRDKYLLGGGRR